MRALISVRLAGATGLAMVVAVATGCADREQELIGKWKASALNSTFKAIKLKEDSGISTQEATEAAKVMAATFVEVKSDKTFTAGMGGATTEGTWTFNKETGEVVLNITTTKAPDGNEAFGGPKAWTAYLDDSDRRLSFYPMPPDSVALLKQSKEKGGLFGGISLYRR